MDHTKCNSRSRDNRIFRYEEKALPACAGEHPADVAREPCYFVAFVWYSALQACDGGGCLHLLSASASVCTSFRNLRCWFGLDTLEYLCKCTYIPLALQHLFPMLWVFLQQFSSGMLVVSFDIFFARLGGIFYIIFQWAIWSDRIR